MFQSINACKLMFKISLTDFNSVRRKIRKRRRKPGNVEEVELQPMNVAGVELQRQQSEGDVEDVKSNYYTGR